MATAFSGLIERLIMTENTTYVRRRKLKRIFQYLKRNGYEIRIKYEYNNSLGHHNERVGIGVISDYSIKEEFGLLECVLYFSNGDGFSVSVPVDAEFMLVKDDINNNVCFSEYGCAIRWCNSGPCCYLKIRLLDGEQ